jgi:DNA-binding CsgD family transcriptional regulator
MATSLEALLSATGGNFRLTVQEHAVLSMSATGRDVADIAAFLDQPPRVVRSALASAIEKLRASSKLDAVVIALSDGLIDVPVRAPSCTRSPTRSNGAWDAEVARVGFIEGVSQRVRSLRSAIAAGLLGRTGTIRARPVAGPVSGLVAALCAAGRRDDERWYEWLDEWHRKNDELTAKRDEILAQIEAYMVVERHSELASKLADVVSEIAGHNSSRELELVIRHMPGLQSVLRLVWAHVMTTGFNEDRACGQGQCSEQCW